MNSKELMIGDWVLLNGNPLKIQAIDSLGAEIVANGDLFCIKEDRWAYTADKIDSIPLTPEILEKNGWNHSNRLMITRIDDNDFYWSEELGGILYKNQYNMCNCKYVHNLQHALRLCGFDELADNFKI